MRAEHASQSCSSASHLVLRALANKDLGPVVFGEIRADSTFGERAVIRLAAAAQVHVVSVVLADEVAAFSQVRELGQWDPHVGLKPSKLSAALIIFIFRCLFQATADHFERDGAEEDRDYQVGNGCGACSAGLRDWIHERLRRNTEGFGWQQREHGART